MNKQWLEVFKKYRERKYGRDLKELQNDLADRGLAQSGLRQMMEQSMQDDYMDEIAMKKEEIAIAEEERRGEKIERWVSILIQALLALAAVGGFFITLDVSQKNLEKSTEANRIAKEVALLERDNAQPRLIIIGGNESATDVKIKNAGGGIAKNIFFLKHGLNSDKKSIYSLTRDSDIKLAIAVNQEGGVNLNSQYMDVFWRKEEILSKAPCVPEGLFNENVPWTAAFYENVHGEKFVSVFLGSGTKYGDGVDFIDLSSCKK